MVPAVVLAAGKSSRMGRLKATLPAGPSETFLSRIVRTFEAAGVTRTVVVLGHQAPAIRAHLEADGLHPDVVVNEGYEAGQLSSLIVGLDAADRPGVEAVLLMPIDAPLVSAATVRAVLERYRTTRAPIVRPVRGDQHGHPVLIDRRLFPLLRAADPAQGAKPVVRAHVSEAGELETDDPGAFMDIDTPDEYARAIGKLALS